MRFALPLGLFILVVALFGVGLTRDPKLVPSPLIGKPAPDFRLDLLATPARALGIDDLRGQVFLLNVWASWCVACGTEHPLLVELAKSGTVDIIGLNYKDERSDALEWLSQRGDPYRLSLHDPAGDFGLDLGVYGVPETFVIDAEGIIRYKHIGPISPDVLERELLPLVAQLKPAST